MRRLNAPKLVSSGYESDKDIGGETVLNSMCPHLTRSRLILDLMKGSNSMWQKSVYVLALTASLASAADKSAPEVGEPSAPSAPGASHEVKWRGYLGLGMSFSPKTDYTVKYQGASLTSWSEKDKAAPVGSLELEGIFHPIFSGSILVDYSQYKYQDGTKNDSSFSLMLMPKVRSKVGLWAGVGLGLNRTGIGDTNYTSGTESITLDDTSVTSFIISPRVGYDFSISPGTTLGGFIAYQTMSSDVTATYIDTSVPFNGKVNYEFNRSWWDFVLRVGFDL